MYMLLVYIVAQNPGISSGPVTIIQQPASSLEVCKKAGELISSDVQDHVDSVSFRCLPATYGGGGFYIKED